MTEPRKRRHPAEAAARLAELLPLLAEGKSNAEIGSVLYLSEDTVKARVRDACIDLGAKNRVHVVALAYQRGLLSVSTPDVTGVTR